MWECLSRQVPWSWLIDKSVRQVMCEEGGSLPIFDIWSHFMETILWACLGEERERASISTIVGHLICIRNSGKNVTSDYLDGRFRVWQGKDAPCIAKKINTNSAKGQLSILFSTENESSKLHILVRRSSLMHSRHKTIEAGLHGIFGLFHANEDECRRKNEIERYGFKAAEQIATVRRIRRLGRNHGRRRWAKESILTRYLEGDLRRISKAEETMKTTGCVSKVHERRHSRRSSVSQGNLEELKIRSLKYERKDWARLKEGHQRANSDVQSGSVSLEPSEVELRRYVRVSSSQALRQDPFQSSEKDDSQEIARTTLLQQTSLEVHALRTYQTANEETAIGTKSNKSCAPTVNASLRWPLSPDNMAEVEITNQTSRPESDSKVTLSCRAPYEDNISRPASDSQVSLLRHKFKLSTERWHNDKTKDRSDDSVKPVVLTKRLQERGTKGLREGHRMAEDSKVTAKTREEFGACLEQHNKRASNGKSGNSSVDNNVSQSHDYRARAPIESSNDASRECYEKRKSSSHDVTLSS